MAREPDDIVLRLLREICSTLGDHSKQLDSLQGEVREMKQLMTYTVGMASVAQFRADEVNAKVSALTDRIQKLEKSK